MRIFASILIFILSYTSVFSQIEEEFTLQVQGETISDMSFNSYENLLAVGTSENHIVVFKLQSKIKVADLYGNGRIIRIKFNPDGNLLAAADSGSIRIWKTKDWELESQLVLNQQITDFDFYDNQHIIFASTLKGQIIQLDWHTNTSKTILVDDKPLTAIHLVSMFNYVATANQAGDLFLYEIKKNKVEQYFYSDNQAIQYIFSEPSNNFIYFVSTTGKTNVIVKSNMEYNNYMKLGYSPFVIASTTETGIFITASNQSLMFYNAYNKQNFFTYKLSINEPIASIAICSYLQLIALGFGNGRIGILSYQFE